VATPLLKIDWATHEAAKYACENWHYSKCMPAGKTLKVGVWEAGVFIGVVVFSGGPSPNIWKTYGLTPIEGSELSRIALTTHKTPVSRIVSIAIKFLRSKCPGIKLIISYADQKQGHHGGIYQAGNWVYLGEFGPKVERLLNGRVIHERNMRQQILDGKRKRSQFTERPVPPKFKYAIGFDPMISARLKSERKPYPKRATSKDSVVIPDQGIEGGAIPTVALQVSGK
jgi:hypothetical protein